MSVPNDDPEEVLGSFPRADVDRRAGRSERSREQIDPESEAPLLNPGLQIVEQLPGLQMFLDQVHAVEDVKGQTFFCLAKVRRSLNLVFQRLFEIRNAGKGMFGR